MSKYFILMNSTLSNIKGTDRCCKILIIFFILFSLISQSVSSSLFFSNTDHSSLILSYFLLSPSVLFHVDVDHQFHANTDADTSLPRRSLSSCGFFFGLWLMGGLGWADWWWVGSDGQIVVHHAAPSISDRLGYLFIFWWMWVEFHGL